MLNRMTAEGTISSGDLNLMLVTDDIEEAMDQIRFYAIERFGLRRVVMKPSPLLGEQREIGAGPTEMRRAA